MNLTKDAIDKSKKMAKATKDKKWQMTKMNERDAKLKLEYNRMQKLE